MVKVPLFVYQSKKYENYNYKSIYTTVYLQLYEKLYNHRNIVIVQLYEYLYLGILTII